MGVGRMGYPFRITMKLGILMYFGIKEHCVKYDHDRLKNKRVI